MVLLVDKGARVNWVNTSNSQASNRKIPLRRCNPSSNLHVISREIARTLGTLHHIEHDVYEGFSHANEVKAFGTTGQE